MNTRKAAPLIATASLVVLMSGCAGATAQGARVIDDLRPAANAAAMGLARGHVIVQDDLSLGVLSAEARRELHAQATQPQSDRTWSAEARRELHAQSTTTVQPFSTAAIRELKGNAPVDVQDDLSPLGGGAR